MKEQATGGVYPHIRESVFGDFANPDITTADSATNSMLLRFICKRMPVRYNGETGEFESEYPWRIRIEDQHDDEAAPHYVLDVSSHPVTKEGHSLPLSSERSVTVTYCDNHSTLKSGRTLAHPEGVIEQARGHFKVAVWADCAYDMKKVTIEVARAYVESMQKTLPDYFVLINENALRF